MWTQLLKKATCLVGALEEVYEQLDAAAPVDAGLVGRDLGKLPQSSHHINQDVHWLVGQQAYQRIQSSVLLESSDEMEGLQPERPTYQNRKNPLHKNTSLGLKLLRKNIFIKCKGQRPEAYFATLLSSAEHFQMIPVTETRSSLLLAFFSRETSGWRPLYWGTVSQVCLSPAHCRVTQQEDVQTDPSAVVQSLRDLFGKCILRQRVRGTEANHLVDGAGRVHLQLLVVAAEVFHQELDHALLLDGRPAALLSSYHKRNYFNSLLCV